MLIAKCSASSVMSSGRSRSGGNVITSNARRSSRSRRKTPLSASVGQVFVGRRDESHFCADRLVAADAFELAVFDDAQDLFLHEFRSRREFVEKQRAAVGAFESPAVIARCAGERADFVAEQFGFEQRVADRRAVHLDELGVPAIRQVVQARGDQFFAGAAFADDQHGLVERGDFRRRRPAPAERPATPPAVVRSRVPCGGFCQLLAISTIRPRWRDCPTLMASPV